LGIRVGISILSILVILVIGFSISPAYAGPVLTDVWPFYGETPQDTVLLMDCLSGGGPNCVGGGTLDAANNPDMGCPGTPPSHPPSCDEGIANDGAVLNVGSSIPYDNIADTGERITVMCFDKAPDPTDGGFIEFDFSVIITDNCLQNQRGDDDLGIGVEGLTVNPQNPDEIQFDEMVVLDIGPLLTAGYTNPMLILSSHSDNHVAWIATSSSAPTGTVSAASLNPLTNAPVTDGIFPGSAQGTGFNDVYFALPLERYIYFQEVSGSTTNNNLDFLVQQIKADIPIIGGTGIQIDTTSILLAGAQTNAYWIIPIVVLATIIGIITIRRK